MVLTAEEIEEWQQVDSDEAIEELLQVSGSESASGYRVKELRQQVVSDRELLAAFYRKASKVGRSQDPQLKALIVEGLKPILKPAVGRQATKQTFSKNERF